jgi:citrate/tricarballylate utilization protein
MLTQELIAEAGRQLTICNACRYCEGYCPVFPAVELRREFDKGDVVFLGHLCHDCRACYHACMYTPPHEFAVNLPKVMAQIRLESYEDWSWPALFGRAFTDSRIGYALAAFAVFTVAISSITVVGPTRVFARHLGPGSFYQVIPFVAMLISASSLCLYSLAVGMIGGVRFWFEVERRRTQSLSPLDLLGAVSEALSLKWLRGGGPGCYYPGAKPSSSRRLYHSFVSYGFLSALISTTLAAIYQDILHRIPPYPVTSAPVIFGTVGGLAMVIGVGGLISLKAKSDSEPVEARMRSLDYSFLVILGLTSLSGLIVLVLRGTAAMGVALVLHLGLTAALFITTPYGKFIHALYRFIALLLFRIQRARKQWES